MSAAFHMAQRMGVILSGDYSGDDEIVAVSKGNYGITRDGTVWHNGYTYDSMWLPKDKWAFSRVPTAEGTIEAFKASTIEEKKNLESAVAFARNLLEKKKKKKKAETAPEGSTTESSGGLTVPRGTWNDGAFTYEIKSSSEAFVPETGVTFRSPDEPTEPRWQKFVSDLNAAYADKRLKEGKAKPRSSGGGGSSYVPAPVVSPAVVAPVATPFYKAKWFLPAVGVATLGVVLLIALWPSKKKKDDAPVVYLPAPPPVPVPVPAPQAV
jgi:hypothetical protein